MDRGNPGAVRACVVLRSYTGPQGDRLLDLQDGPNVYERVPQLDLIGGARSFLALPAQTQQDGAGVGALAVVSWTQGSLPRPVVLGFLPSSQSREAFTEQAQTAAGVPAFASVRAGELRVQDGRVGVGEDGAPFVDATLSAQSFNVAVVEGEALRVEIARRLADGALEAVAPVNERVPLGLAQQAYLDAQVVAKINDLAAQVALLRAAVATLGVTLPPWGWTPAAPPDASQLAAALLVSSKPLG